MFLTEKMDMVGLVLRVTVSGMLSGCDRIPYWSKAPVKKEETKSEAQNSPQSDANSTDQENYTISVDISCLVEFFPYRDIDDLPGFERIRIERSRTAKTKDGWGPVVVSEVKVTSRDKKFDGSLIASNSNYATIAFGGQVIGGATTNLFVTTYMIDLTSLRFKRTVSLFPFGEEKISKGVCRNSTAS
jgi:hypothetical protein